ncbi:3-isopropylmalate dehydratase small subunit [Buchnera aphidicola]|uniref:3-isopropylmalate dehydratase small subunit n=1 Tax=Buchnera aphidicola (Therioaphis trifolii) TaxID=1241884 RepID=A0A4D6YM71_9GAMM|nr:3-isopropylmalate dehydratase small subunit [Buchnera aphidicola]QCI27220.1 3-isopropylmalate dehydratase small subunit [Buchnera aphidicola (Therioaphis trifolii)]
MKKFIHHTGIIAPLDLSNVDTDAIIPKQFLQKIDKTGFSDSLFYNWRFLEGNKKHVNLNFVLNKSQYQKSSILITRNNFGCGSSREHAVWALLDYGFRVIIAPSFADIFYSNSFNNHLLLITLSEKNINNIFHMIYNNPGIKATINLYKKKIKINNLKYDFKIDDFYRSCLLEGLDNIDLTLKNKKKILKYEKSIPKFLINLY